jgi:small subunit ribosomal protein S8
MTDPIADFLTRIRNAIMVRHPSVTLPASKIKIGLAQILKEEGFIRDFEVSRSQGPKRGLRMHLRYNERNVPTITNLKRISKPGLRIYAVRKEIPRPYGGLGISILSTSKGLMTGKQAWQEGVGGEVLCQVW